MKLAVFFILLFLSPKVFSQSYFSVGTTWNYNYSTTSGTCPVLTCESGQSTIKVVGDTLINGMTAKKIMQYDYYSQYGAQGHKYRTTSLGFLYIQNDSVMLTSKDPDFEPVYLFGFNMHVKDTLIINSNLSIAVDSIKSENVNGQLRKVFYVSKFYPYGSMGAGPTVHKVIEGIGPADDYLLWNNGSEEYGTTYTFTCYSDDQSIYPTNATCASVLGTSAAEPVSFTVHPIPCKDHLEISTSISSDILVEIYTLQGIKIQSFTLSNPNTTLKVNSLLDGIYILKITDDQGRYSSKQIVIEN